MCTSILYIFNVSFIYEREIEEVSLVIIWFHFAFNRVQSISSDFSCVAWSKSLGSTRNDLTAGFTPNISQ